MSNIRLSTGAACLAIFSAAAITAPAAQAATSVAAQGGTAHRAPQDCEGGTNGFVDIPDTLAGRVRGVAIDYGGTKVTLETGQVQGRERGWARLSGGFLNYSDKVWMDFTKDGGKTWIQCGPFMAAGKQSKTSAAMYTTSSSLWRFRACGDLYRGVFDCSDWW